MKKAFTLIELLIVVAIIGIIVAIAIPNLLAAVQKARQKRTMSDIRVVATMWETYFLDYAYYWNAGGCLSPMPDQPITASCAVGSILMPTYMANLPLKDGWNNPLYFYVDKSSLAQEYRIESRGNDSAVDSYCGMITSFGNDIVMSNGQFIEWPEGVQQGKWNG